MSKTYQKARPSDLDLLAEIIGLYHPEIEKHNVSIDIIFEAHHDKAGGLIQGLTHNGYPAAGAVKINGLRERALGMADALITIDRAAWEDSSDDEHRAILDHELEHIETVGKDDDLGRPRLKIKQHDWQIGGFYAVAERHKNNALEVQAVHAHRDERGQYIWDFDEILARAS